MQQATALEAQVRDVLVVHVFDGVARQDGVAVMAVIVDDVAAVGSRRPNVFGKKIVLAAGWPVADAFCMPSMFALHFLQENDVGAQ